jgi:putative endonuclease
MNSAGRPRNDGTGIGPKLTALRRGRRGELLAMLFLMAKGYRVVARNFRCKSGEIDIVARRGDLIVFVEVKARDDPSAGVDAVGFRAQRRISGAANIWIGRQSDAARLSWRFDIIAVPRLGLPRHYPDVFAGA